MISGLADIDSGMYFVELYASTDIPNIGIYTLVTENVISLPSRSLTAGQYFIISSESTDDMTLFFGDSTIEYAQDGDVKLGGGNDPVFLKLGLETVDAFGVEGASYGYKHGWVMRNNGTKAPNPNYSPSDWTMKPSMLTKCWINDNPGGNDNCPGPYKQGQFQREFKFASLDEHFLEK